MDRVLVFAGTSEGRSLAEYLEQQGIEIHVCVATEYGGELMHGSALLHLHEGRLNTAEMAQLMKTEQITLTIDATHPYAAEVTANIQQACEDSKTEYLRLLRKESCAASENCVYVSDVREAADYLKGTKGNILLTTGSKELGAFTDIEDYQSRVFARVLPAEEVVKSCRDLGITGKQLICMQGPFTQELNEAMIRQLEISWLVTKESGRNGGFEEKLAAAEQTGAGVVIIRRPEAGRAAYYAREKCYGEMELRSYLEQRLSLQARRKISLVGIGLGNPETITAAAARACLEAQVLIGARRMLDSAAHLHKDTYESHKPQEIYDYLQEHPEYQKVAILLSGDVGFYSAAKQLQKVFSEDHIERFSGISSLVYFCSKLAISWEDVKLCSLHGRKQNIIDAVKHNEKVFTLVGKRAGAADICRKLTSYGFGEAAVYIGEKLSYPDETIIKGKACELQDIDVDALAVVLISNPTPRKHRTHGIDDEQFIRDTAPMTKAEVRSVSLSKLRITRDAVAYDVGAGTGSVAVEMALQAYQGEVYAIEKKAEAAALIERNKAAFAADNLTVIPGMAPEALKDLPAPNHVFIGGSSGNMEEIIRFVLERNPAVRIVVNAIALETVSEVIQCLKELEITDAEVIQVAASRAKTVASYHMMMGLNPVYIIAFGKGA